MANHFNDLSLQTLKEVSIRLERLEGRVDHIINEKADKADVQNLKADGQEFKAELKSITEKLDQKADKTDVEDLKAELKSVTEKLDQKADKTDVEDLKAELKSVTEKLDQKADKTDVNTLSDEVRSQAQRLDRIETGIKTLQWTMTAGLAILGIILAFVRSC
ncbi:MAG: hypothetical protein OXU51_00600 [Candidatus Poribacteria bacterium]|nr:hypothetical protein [Candidatus Poribacteria bacterium]